MLMKSSVLNVLFDPLHQRKNFSLKHKRTDFCDVGSTRRMKLCVTICTLLAVYLFIHLVALDIFSVYNLYITKHNL